MPRVELREKLDIAVVRVASVIKHARVIVNDHPLVFPDAAQEELHLRPGKIIGIGFDPEGFPIGKKVTPVDRRINDY